MPDDIVARLRVLNHHAKKLAENESLHDLHRDALTRCENLTWEAADEIERLKKELGQVEGADAWVSETDAAHIASLVNWCEFNAMDWHRALSRLVNDRARLRGEMKRLRELFGDARQLRDERDEARREVCEMSSRCVRADNWKRIMQTPTHTMPKDVADSRGWDCFKEAKP